MTEEKAGYIGGIILLILLVIGCLFADWHSGDYVYYPDDYQDDSYLGL